MGASAGKPGGRVTRTVAWGPVLRLNPTSSTDLQQGRGLVEVDIPAGRLARPRPPATERNTLLGQARIGEELLKSQICNNISPWERHGGGDGPLLPGGPWAARGGPRPHAPRPTGLSGLSDRHPGTPTRASFICCERLSSAMRGEGVNICAGEVQRVRSTGSREGCVGRLSPLSQQPRT